MTKPHDVVIEWRRVVDNPNYDVSDTGLIRRSIRSQGAKGDRILAPWLNQDGYLRVNLRLGGKRTECRIHKAVMLAFIGPPPTGMQVNHINAIKTDNRLENLEYVTPQQNIKHSVELKLHAYGERNGNAVLNDFCVLFMRALFHRGVRMSDIAKSLGISCSITSGILNRKSWKHL